MGQQGSPPETRPERATILAAQEPCGQPVSGEAETAPEALGIHAAFWPLALCGQGGQQPSGVGPDAAPASSACPECGGRVLGWTFGRVCASCHRRVPTVVGDRPDVLERHGWEQFGGVRA